MDLDTEDTVSEEKWKDFGFNDINKEDDDNKRIFYDVPPLPELDITDEVNNSFEIIEHHLKSVNKTFLRTHRLIQLSTNASMLCK